MMDLASSSDLFTAAGAALENCGWFVQHDAFSAAFIARLLAQAKQEKFHLARIGGEKNFRRDIRGDEIAWLENENLLSHFVEKLRVELNRQFFLGLHHFEGHFAHYPPGAFYRGHFDQPRASTLTTGTRLISVILYLNPHWQTQDGGELIIWEGPNRERPLASIAPRAGTLVIFRSDCIFHEVLETKADRWSLTGWLRRK